MIVLGRGQRQTNGKVRQISDPFAFLVQGERMSISTQVKIESLDILLKFDIDPVNYRTEKAQVDAILTNFQGLTFFTQDQALKNEYLSFFYISQQNYNNFHKNMEALFTFKGVEECKNTTRCHTLALEISLDDIKRAKTNLQYRYNKIDPVNWTPTTISTHREQQNTLLSLISVFDEFSAEMFRKSDLMITAIESLSNKIFPEDLLSSVPGVCNDTSLYEGEAYYVKHCTGCKSGYQCVVQTDTPAATTQVTKMMPVAYQGIHLVGKEPKYIFARTAELELKQLECEYEEGNIEYPSCQIHDLPVVCKKALDENDVRGAIHGCTFTREHVSVSSVIPNGGVLVQDLPSEMVQINEGGSVVTKPPPIIIYSAQEVHVKNGDEEYVYAPLINSTEARILESMLTVDDIYKLVSVQYWREVSESFSPADYIRYTLILIQFVILPLAIYNLVITVRTRNQVKVVSEGKRNYKINRNEYLLKRVK
jgi:hypothetical protein